MSRRTHRNNALHGKCVGAGSNPVPSFSCPAELCGRLAGVGYTNRRGNLERALSHILSLG